MTLWKVVKAIFNTCFLASIQFHSVLHRFRAGIGTWTVTMELNIAQELSSIYQDLSFLVFLRLRKACDTVDHGRLMRTLEGYSAGPHMYKLLATFWVHQEVVTKPKWLPWPEI